MKLKTILTFLVLTLFTACGGKQGDTTSASISLGFGSISNNALVDGGVMIYGWSDGGQSFAIKYTNEVLELENGNWRFAAFGWDDFALSGDLRCSYIPNVILNGGDETINLTLNQVNCNESVFGGNDVKDPTTGVPYILKFKTCGNDSCLFDDDGGDAPLRGVAQSFKVILPGKTLDGALVKGQVFGTHGPCNVHDVTNINTPDAYDGRKPETTPLGGIGPTGDIRVPIVNLEVPVIIRAYDETGCTGSFEEYTFERGLKGIDAERTFLQSDGTNNIISLMSDICRNPNRPANLSGRDLKFWAPSDGGSPATPNTNYICTAAHLKEVGVRVNDGTIDSHTIVLGKNIDASLDSGYVPIGSTGTPFSGSFYGNGNQISNFSMTSTNGYLGLFGKVTGKIESLNLKSFSITNNGGSGNNHFGALVGQIDGGEIRDVHGEDLTIDIINCASCFTVGGVIGAIRSSSNDSSNFNISASDVHIKTHDNVSNVGGLVGQVGDTGDTSSASLRTAWIDQVILEHTVTSTNQGSNFGGIAGKVESEVWNVFAKNVNMGGYTDSTKTTTYDFSPTQYVGGIAGIVSGTSGTNIGKINYARSSGMIYTEDTNSVGGVIGFIENTRGVEDIISNVEIDAFSNSPTTVGVRVGGVIGSIGNASTNNSVRAYRLRNYGDILNCADECGGVLGGIDDSGDGVEIRDAHNYGDIGEFDYTIPALVNPVAGSKVGGIVGFYSGSMASTTIDYSHNEGNIYATGNVGGIIGTRSGSGGILKFHYAYNLGDIYTDSATQTDAAGLVSALGTVDDGDFTNLYNIGDTYYDASGTIAAAMADFGTATDGGTPPTAGTTLCDAIGGTINSSLTNTLCSTISDPTTFGSYTQVSSNTSEWVDFGDGTPAFFNWLPIQELENQTIGTLGSPLDPFKISSTTKWNLIGDNPLLMGRSFELTNDLDFNNNPTLFNPIASSTYPFTGNFNGNNFEIRNILLDETSAVDHLGIFRVIGEKGFCEGTPSNTTYAACGAANWRIDGSGQIGDRDEDIEEKRKLYLRNIKFRTDAGSTYNIGIIAGHVEDQESAANRKGRGIEISNVEIINGSVGGATTGHVGTAIGKVKIFNSNTEIEGIKSSAIILTGECGTTSSGGIIGDLEITNTTGMNQDLRMDNFQYNGGIDCASINDIGGIIGNITNSNTSYNLEIERLANNANIVGGTNVGGLFGQTSAGVLVSAGYSKGNITGTDEVAGITGLATAGVYTAVYAEGNLSTTGDAGGIIATCTTCDLHNSFSNISFSGSETAFNYVHVNGTANAVSNTYYVTSLVHAPSSTTANTTNPFVLNGGEFDPANMPNLSTGLPGPYWFHFFGSSPKLYFEVLDESVLD